MAHRRHTLTGACVGAVAAGLLLLGMPHTTVDDLGTTAAATDPAPPSPAAGPPGPGPTGAALPAPAFGHTPMGAFTSSGADGVRRIADLQKWLGGTDLAVGHTYLPGEHWDTIEGEPELLQPWAQWKNARPDRLFVLNVPMQERNEQHIPDSQVRTLLRSGAAGRFDGHFLELARRLVGLGVPDTVIVLGWEMNGTTYTHRCGPDPASWKTYWNRIVTTMRSVPGQRFRFDFTPNRGQDAIGWTSCYPGDSVVDIIGMDSYDQPPGDSFYDQVEEPFGLQAQVDFAAAHGKAISYPEWGLFRNGDNADYMRMMLQWITDHRAVYQTLTDYCPHGVWQCSDNPKSSKVFRSKNFGRVEPVPAPTPAPSVPTPDPTTTPTIPTTPTTPTTTPTGTPGATPGPTLTPVPAPSPGPGASTAVPAPTVMVPVPVGAFRPAPTLGSPAAPAEVCLPLELGDASKHQFGLSKLCFRIEWQSAKKI
ncbi:glycoside hydrolase family 26 protein [Streptomyces sp. H39-S7]|uniref:glycoside hydrolase family 26 protein n=1 Tax=Streptomyces sp. H39-S7 TaxID=3004357 RepID=UPI0022B01BB3|nr:glycosyl hydrolase [Streptomyces sp. H39-S7]MCZ4117962.1 glycosyl hydrolase [Streptomyces sp. H39-S7]